MGAYGSGKSYFLQLISAMARQQDLVTMHADLTPDRRLYGHDGQARSLYSELTRNCATRSKPEGGALSAVLERLISSAMEQARSGDLDVEEIIHERLHQLKELVGDDFAEVLTAYWRGHDNGDVALKDAALRWMRGEYSTRGDARNDLGVRSIVDDASVYDQLKLLARFVVLAGYDGLLVCVDELVNLYKLSNSQARRNNYEQVLRIVNDCVQGGAEHLGFIFAGTPETLTDTRRGLYSYEALQSRLAENAFATNGLRDLSGPVLRLPGLSPEELYVLLTRLREVHASGDPERYLIPDQGLGAS